MVAESRHFRNVCLLEVKCKKEEDCVDSVSRNGESESVLFGSHNGKSMSVGRWGYM